MSTSSKPTADANTPQDSSALLGCPENDIDLRERSILSLAYVGDSVLELLVRSHLVAPSRFSPGVLHQQAIPLVSAKGQFALLTQLEAHLTPAEQDIVRRGRNATKATVSKNATPEEYRASTGLEALFGWLYMQNKLPRIETLFAIMWRAHEESTGDGDQTAG